MEREPLNLFPLPGSDRYPPPGAKRPRIGDEISAATCGQHHVLNPLILTRLPLALPPACRDPSVYGRGIAAFASIYIAFEQVWDELVSSTISNPPGPYDTQSIAVRKWLATLRPPGLARTERFRRDLDHLSRVTGLDLGTKSHALERIVRKQQYSVRKKPHTLVAFAWVMYMALFSGGRVIRHQLARAGTRFWQDPDQESTIDAGSHHKKASGPPGSMPGFSFLYFDDGKDGNELKAMLMSRLAEADDVLTNTERREVVQAAVSFFDDLTAVVRILDVEVGGKIIPWRPPWSRRGIVTGVVLSSLLGLVGYGIWNGSLHRIWHIALSRSLRLYNALR